jgi:hypothetical protein
MKKFITLTSLSLLLGMGVCSTVSAKPVSFHIRSLREVSSNEQVSFIPLKKEKGFAVMVDKPDPGKSMVIIYDKDKNVVFKNCLTKNVRAEKKYNMAYLDKGDYTVEVYSKMHDVKTPFYVYNNGETKTVHML